MVLLLEVLKNDPTNGRETDGTTFIGIFAGEIEGRLALAAVRTEETNIREAVKRLGNEKRMGEIRKERSLFEIKDANRMEKLII